MPVFRRSRRTPPQEIERRIRAALEELRPLLRVESFSVELLRFDAATGVAHLSVHGGCTDCEMTPATLTHGIEAHLRRNVPQVTAVEAASAPGS